MLTTLRIENIAVIEKAEVDFTDGFCVLTGETGAGKSILIDSLSAVLGNRTSKDLVRQGSDRAFISALFEDCSPAVAEVLEEMGVSCEDNSVLLTRTITADGRTKCTVNGYASNTAVLRKLAVLLVNIHGQQDNHSLLDPFGHVAFLDRLYKKPELLENYTAAYQQLKFLEEEREKLQMGDALRARQIDMLTYQVDELTAANLQPGEYADLTARQKAFANGEKIAQAIGSVMNLLDGDGNTQGAVSMVQDAVGYMQECTRYMDVEDQTERLNSLYLELDALLAEIRTTSDELSFDPRDQAEIEERLDVLYRLSRKYGADEEEMLAFLDKASSELDSLLHAEENVQHLDEDIAAAEQKAKDAASVLSDARRKAADELDRAVCEELRFLNMPNVVFTTAFTPCDMFSGGMEKIEFLISANPGEPPKPLSKIASGGELSRIMLAIVSVLMDDNPVGTLVFDEIDAGISGRAAIAVGNRLQKTSGAKQVICITHLAQIAAKANAHYLIEKDIVGQRASTTVNRLQPNDRLKELARIIGGEQITEAALQTARELVEQA